MPSPTSASRPGLPIGLASEYDRFDYRLEHGPCSLWRIESAHRGLRDGWGVELDDIEP